MSSSSPSRRRVKNQGDAAKELGVSDRTLQRWEKATWFPTNGKTKAGYDVESIAAARPKSDQPSNEESPLRAKAREAEHVKTIYEGTRAKIRCETEELKLRTAQGELIPRHGIEQSYADLLTGIADWCEQLPDLFASMLSIPRKHHAACRELLCRLLAERQRELRDDLETKALTRDKDKRATHE